jgi:hypothetical protein
MNAPHSPPGATERSARSSATLLRTVAELAGPQHALLAARTIVAWANGFITMELAGAFRLGGDIEQAWTFGLDQVMAAIRHTGRAAPGRQAPDAAEHRQLPHGALPAIGETQCRRASIRRSGAPSTLRLAIFGVLFCVPPTAYLGVIGTSLDVAGLMQRPDSSDADGRPTAKDGPEQNQPCRCCTWGWRGPMTYRKSGLR